MWSLAGCVLALAIAIVAWRKSATLGGFYDAGVYGMTPALHRRYALVSLAFAVFFALTVALKLPTAGLVGLTLYALVAVFYVTSFLRGAELDE